MDVPLGCWAVTSRLVGTNPIQLPVCRLFAHDVPELSLRPPGGGVRDRNYAYTWIARPFGVHRRVVGVCGGCDHSFKGASDEGYAVAGSATLVARHRSGRSCWAPASATRHH